MFLGIFSSILPYLIAAGFYLLWLAFSFIQPWFQKDTEELSVSEDKIITIDQRSDIPASKTYHYKTNSLSNQALDDQVYYFTDLIIPDLFLVKIIPQEPLESCKINHTVSIYFSRPPPVC